MYKCKCKVFSWLLILSLNLLCITDSQSPQISKLGNGQKEAKHCTESEFQCENKQCIPKLWVCDGIKNCEEGSDEWTRNCNSTAGDQRKRNKRQTGNSCAVPAPSVDKKITYRCAVEGSKSCATDNGYVPEFTIAVISCNQNYQPEEKPHTPSICYNRSWVPQIENCFKTCDKLKPENVDLQCFRNGVNITCEKKPLLTGTKIRPTCKQLYEYNGYVPNYLEITCKDDGKWDQPLFSCIPECGRTYNPPKLLISKGIFGDSPWHVAIYNENQVLICEGIIISPDLVISAAHCFYDESNNPPKKNASLYEIVVSKYTRNYTKKDNDNQKIYKYISRSLSESGQFDLQKFSLKFIQGGGTRVRPSCKQAYQFSSDSLPNYSEIRCNSRGKWDNNLFTCTPECGLTLRFYSLVTGGGGTRENFGNSPWHVAIYNKEKVLICGGTIITPYLIISAAHCFHDDSPSAKINDDIPNNFEVVVGKVTRNYDTKDSEAQKIHKIGKIRFPDKGFHGMLGSFQADIAILILEEEIKISPVVMPACIDWTALEDYIYPTEDAPGKVVGWGINEHGNYSESLMAFKLSFISHQRCIKTVHDDFKRFITIDKFCAGSETGPRVLQGDSGGGLLFKKNNRYYLYGIVSVKEPGLTGIAAFTDLAEHVRWIQKVRDEFDKELKKTANETQTTT